MHVLHGTSNPSSAVVRMSSSHQSGTPPSRPVTVANHRTRRSAAGGHARTSNSFHWPTTAKGYVAVFRGLVSVDDVDYGAIAGAGTLAAADFPCIGLLRIRYTPYLRTLRRIFAQCEPRVRKVLQMVHDSSGARPDPDLTRKFCCSWTLSPRSPSLVAVILSFSGDRPHDPSSSFTLRSSLFAFHLTAEAVRNHRV